MFSNDFLHWLYLWPQAMRNFFQVPETCVLDELHVFAHRVPTFLNAFQCLFPSTHISPSGFTFFCEVLADTLCVSIGYCTQPTHYQSSSHIGGNCLFACCSFPLNSELPAMEILLSISQYRAEGLADSRCQKLCVE